MRASQTLEDEYRYASHRADELPGPPEPGLILIFSAGQPTFAVIPLDHGSIVVGRGEVAGVMIPDKRMSHPHARISFNGQAWTLHDLGSRNGSAADGVEIQSGTKQVATKIVRTGSSIFLLAEDVRPFRAGMTRSGDTVIGPRLQRTLEEITRVARDGTLVLLINGESGAGKELAARTFHNAGPRASGPFVPVNSATLKPEFAEVMLFGSIKGFYTDAKGGPGFVQAADGGTLFLDEIAELSAPAQATLLRVLQEREVTPLGTLKPVPVDFRFCSATHADLQAMVAAGKMRQDLHYRIKTPTVVLPPLRQRIEEIPWLIELALQKDDPKQNKAKCAVHAMFVEACLLRPWPGNVRELVAEVKHAALSAANEGNVLLARHLAERAGQAAVEPSTPMTRHTHQPPAKRPAKMAPTREGEEKTSDEKILETLKATGFNKVKAAKALGMHRTQLYRWLEAHPGIGEDGGDD